MELTKDVDYNELLQVIKNLPEEKISQLKADLSTFTPTKIGRGINSFQDFLLKGPVMSDEQYKNYKENRNHFNKWRTK